MYRWRLLLRLCKFIYQFTALDLKKKYINKLADSKIQVIRITVTQLHNCVLLHTERFFQSVRQMENWQTKNF